MNHNKSKTIFVLILILTQTKTEIVPPDINFEYECVKKFHDEMANFHFGLYFLEDDNTENVFKNIYPKIISNRTGIHFGIGKPDFYFFILKIIKLEQVFQEMYKHFNWNPRATFFISSKVQNIHNILEVANKYFVQNLYICNEKSQGPLGTKGKNWNNYTLQILTAYIPPYVFLNKHNQTDGIEVRCLKTIQDSLKFNFIFLNHTFKSWGLLLPDGNYTDMFRKLQNYEVDIVMGMWPTNFTHILNFDVSFPYLDEALIWMVPKAQVLPHWKRLVSDNRRVLNYGTNSLNRNIESKKIDV